MTDSNHHEKSEVEDPELNELLDSALKDFDKTPVINVENGNATTSVDPQKPVDKCEIPENAENKWTEDFLQQTTEQFEKNLQNLLQNGDDSELGAALQKLGQASTSNLTDDNISTDFQSAISQVLKELSATSENLQNETDLAAMLGQTSLDGDNGGILPFMQGMMQHLLSKEILYPSLKELSDKYPAWLEKQKGTLSPLDLQRYTKQSELMQKVCNELEKEKEDDTEEIKKLRFESVMSLMQEMQTYGLAPEELIGDQSMLFQFDSEGNPVLSLPPGVESQQDCCIM